jgi:hypothetical protein
MSDLDWTVNVWLDSLKMQKGTLSINANEVFITLESGEIISSKKYGKALYSVTEDPRYSDLKIRLDPLQISSHLYASGIGQVTEDIFPPSSGGFYGRLQAGTERSIFCIQEVSNNTGFWLVIGDSKTGKIHETQLIQPYEFETLKLTDDQEVYDEWTTSYWSDKEETLKNEIESVLKGPSPSWNLLSKLVVDVSIADLVRGDSIKETLNQLIPKSFPDFVRNQLMFFLASILLDRINKEDVIDPSAHIYAGPMYSSLLQGHLRCEFDEVKWPPYLKLILQSSSGQLEKPKRTFPELSESSWRFLLQKLVTLFPNWFGNAIISAQELNQSSTFRPRLPITQSQAMRTKKLWKKRLSTMTYNLQVRGQVNSHLIGLNELVYLGAAYRWPHRHMRFITRLGILSDNPPHLQVMCVPSTGMERIMRVLPQCIRISWSKRVVNLNLYDNTSQSWKIPIHEILDSVENNLSTKKLTGQFSIAKKTDTYQISTDEAIILDLISRGILMEDFEKSGYFDYWNMNERDVASIIRKLHKKGILQITYELTDPTLVSIASIVQGNPRKVASFVSNLLTNTPTSLVMLNHQIDSGVIISRFPEEAAYELVTKLNQPGIQQDFAIRCLRPRTFRSFTSTLYQRLLKPDGTWDDDVSAFLSQARSKRRELSESNA